MKTLDRVENLERLAADPRFDVVIIGGGATGLGSAVDSAARGYRTLLLEAGDFASGTSSKSTKLIHGGVRYLAKGNIGLVREALHERRLLLRNAPHLVHRRSFLVPAYKWWERSFYGLGLAVYDWLAGAGDFARSSRISRAEVLSRIPGLRSAGLRGGIVYEDGQFDDARLAIALARTFTELGGVALNYARVEGFEQREGRIRGVRAVDLETGRELIAATQVVVNAAGVEVDLVRRLDDPAASRLLTPSQGTHLVFDLSFLGSETALLAPKTDDGRVLFAIPWNGRLLLGTTDTPVPAPVHDPRPLDAEINYLIEHAARYLEPAPTRSDVLSAFAGLRPLLAGRPGSRTKTLSREHAIIVDRSGLVTVTGGKWTTYRKMAEDAIDRALLVGGLGKRPSITAELALHGAGLPGEGVDLSVYGAEAVEVDRLCGASQEWSEPLAAGLPYRVGEVIWAVQREAARTVEDVLARRTRLLFLDARLAAQAAARVADLMAELLGRDERWRADQVAAFQALAAAHLPCEAAPATSGLVQQKQP